MNKNRTYKLTSLLLTFAMLVSMLMVSVSAAVTGVKLEFTYPEDVKAEDVTITLYEGYAPRSGIKYIEKLTEIPADENGQFTVPGAGTYSYWVKGDGYYSVCKIFNVFEDEVKAGVKEIEVDTSPMAGTGYEPTNADVPNAPEGYTQDARDQVMVLLPDEILEKFTTEDLVGYEEFQTPFFTTEHAEHEVTSDEEMNAFVQEQADSCDFMYRYSMGLSPVYKFNMPLVLCTETEIPENASFNEAVDLARANGKINILIQAQIHSNEPAAGEGALALIDDLAGEYGAECIKSANIIVIPRINPEGAYLFHRYNYTRHDMNRDHMAVQTTEIANIHKVYQAFLPEVIMDGHEFTYHISLSDGFMKNSDDVETTPATSLNIDPKVTELALDMADSMHSDFKDSGLRSFHYSYTVNNPIGRAYYGLYNSISFLVETRGIGGGTNNYARRVFSHQIASHGIIDFAIENAAEIQTAVAAARQHVVELGATYDEDDVLALHQTASGNTLSPSLLTSYRYNIDCVTPALSRTEKLSLNDTITRGRIRPTAYVLPAELENMDEILHLMDSQGIEYYKLDAGSSAELQQYYYEAPYVFDGKNKGFTAGLRDSAEVTFDYGAYVFPMDQWSGNVLAMTMEPDVNDSNGYNGTLVQSGFIGYDETTKDFPLYRYIGDNPRTTLDSNPEKLDYLDVHTNDWYYPAVYYTHQHGLMKGISQHLFAPYAPMSRAMMVQTLYAAAGKPETTLDASKQFRDVRDGAWYEDAVGWAVENGIAAGYGNGKFGPNDRITREQAAVMMYAAAGKPAVEGELNFADAGCVSDWAADAMVWAMQNHIMKGVGENLLMPRATAVRAEAAVMLMQFDKNIK